MNGGCDPGLGDSGKGRKPSLFRSVELCALAKFFHFAFVYGLHLCFALLMLTFLPLFVCDPPISRYFLVLSSQSWIPFKTILMTFLMVNGLKMAAPWPAGPSWFSWTTTILIMIRGEDSWPSLAMMRASTLTMTVPSDYEDDQAPLPLIRFLLFCPPANYIHSEENSSCHFESPHFRETFGLLPAYESGQSSHGRPSTGSRRTRFADRSAWSFVTITWTHLWRPLP